MPLLKSTCVGDDTFGGKQEAQKEGGRIQCEHVPYSSCSPPQGKCCHQALHSQGHFDPPKWEFGEYSTGPLLGHSTPRALHQGGRNLSDISKWNHKRINSQGPNLRLGLLL